MRELESARRELEQLRQFYEMNLRQQQNYRRETPSDISERTENKVSVKSVAELLSCFEGNGSSYEN